MPSAKRKLVVSSSNAYSSFVNFSHDSFGKFVERGSKQPYVISTLVLNQFPVAIEVNCTCSFAIEILKETDLISIADIKSHGCPVERHLEIHKHTREFLALQAFLAQYEYLQVEDLPNCSAPCSETCLFLSYDCACLWHLFCRGGPSGGKRGCWCCSSGYCFGHSRLPNEIGYLDWLSLL